VLCVAGEGVWVAFRMSMFCSGSRVRPRHR
jgi:hypothetical protein